MIVERASDRISVVLCKDCQHCYSLDADPLKPYDGEPIWYCMIFDVEWPVLALDPARFYCGHGERRED